MYTLQTPTYVFSAISLLMIAYTSRYVAITQVIRQLNENGTKREGRIDCQIKSLMKRVKYIRNMQISALVGFSLNILTMILIALGFDFMVPTLFLAGLAFVLVSLVICILEIALSAQALSISLSDEQSDCPVK
ncbi:MAG: DUF2721 domain-containing protein [Erysipelotrichaceae bacterium]|nr:DUF2721 domain-containing protein [Erysipelotrichaceae bacterium]MDD3809514.1 DUF2721 domain-containing protein [Erysipelotrichaceae bacterium]